MFTHFVFGYRDPQRLVDENYSYHILFVYNINLQILMFKHSFLSQ